MLNWFYRALDNKKGFTLIEVLVVVAIIGILAAIATPNILRRIESARIGNDEALVRTIENAIASYLIDNSAENPKYVPYEDIEGGLDGFDTMLKNYLDPGAYDSLTLAPPSGEGEPFEIKGRVLTIIYTILEDEGYTLEIDKSTYPEWHANFEEGE